MNTSTPSVLKRVVKQGFRAAGFELTKFSPQASLDARMAATLRHFGVELLLDVGANIGQYASGMREAGYAQRIVSFEPLSAAHAALARRAAGDPTWQVEARCAVGSANGEIEINIAGNSFSSSILPMMAAHSEAAPHTAYVGSERVRIVRLDSVFQRLRPGRETTCLKIDTQGYEWEVLDGLAQHIDDVTLVQLELSLVPLYAGQRLAHDYLDRMRRSGFEIWSLAPEFVHPRTGQTLQFEGVFYRP